MKCLFLCPFPPFPPNDGGRIRAYQLIKGLAKRHQVDVLCLGDGVHDDATAAGLAAIGVGCEMVPHTPNRLTTLAVAAWRGRSLYWDLFSSEPYRERLLQRLTSTHYDIVQCESAYMAPYITAGMGTAWVLDEHNIEFALSRSLAETSPGVLYRMYARREARFREREELAACRRVNRVVVMSVIDGQRLQEALPEAVVSVVPNGVDLDFFDGPAKEPGVGHDAVFIGKLGYRPNRDAVEWFCAEVLPLVRSSIPDFRVQFIGSGAFPRRRALERLPGVSFPGFVEDTRPFLRSAAVVIVPLRAGSGTRLKILEALAMGAGLVSTSVGAEGIDVQDGVHALLADTPELFAANVIRLIQDPTLRSELGIAGRRLVERQYGWHTVVEQMEQVYREIVPPVPVPAGAARCA